MFLLPLAFTLYPTFKRNAPPQAHAGLGYRLIAAAIQLAICSCDTTRWRQQNVNATDVWVGVNLPAGRL